MVFFRINDVDIMKTCKSPKMRLFSKLLVTLQPQWAPFVENMQSTQLKVKKKPFSILAPQEPGSVLLRSQLAPQEQGRCSSGALAPEELGSVLLRSPLRVGAPQELGSVLLRSTPGSELLGSQGRCSSGAGARGGSCQERPSPTTPYFGPYGIISIDGSRIHVRCSSGLGGELLCAPKQLRYYHSPDDLSWDEWRLSDSAVERIDLEKAASPEESDELEEMTADEMAVDGYYVVAGIARHEYKQGWKFLTLWDGHGLSEATWEPMSAFIQPDGSINSIFHSYLVENNEGQLLTRAETLSQRKKKN